MRDTPTSASSVRMLDEARERQLLARYRTSGDGAALAELLLAHRPLVERIVRRYCWGTIRRDDVVAEGMLGLMEAARRFDTAHRVRFATYATHWVRAFVQRHALDHRRIVPMPDTRGARRVRGRIGKVEPRLAATLGRAPSNAELAEAIGVDPDELASVRAATSTRDVAIDPSPDADSGWELGDDRSNPENEVGEAEDRAVTSAALARAVDTLPSRERVIIERRRLAEEPVVLDVLAREMSISRERVRQLEVKALGHLRAMLAAA